MRGKLIMAAAAALLPFMGITTGWVRAAESTGGGPGPRIYDVVEDYSTTANPTGPWAYGWKSALNSGFTPYAFHGVAPSSTATLDYWMKHAGAGASALYHNPGPENYIHSEGSVFPPNTLWLAPGYEGNIDNFGVIRFTVPANGTYRLRSEVQSSLSSSSSGDYDFHVVHNDVELFGRSMPPRSSTGYSAVHVLAAGDTIDFAVGRGADNREYGSAVFMRITFEEVSETEPPEPPAGMYDLVADYSTTQNPTGPWAYGWKPALDSGFTGYGFHGVAPSSTATLDYWMKHAGAGASALYHNPGPQNYVHSEGSVFPPNTLWLAPGYEGNIDNFGVIRFTVPATGIYQLKSAVRSSLSSSSSGDYDFHVVHNNTELFGQFMPPRSSTGYSNVLVLAAGDTIDFAVGRGADNREYGSAIFMEITFDPITAAELVGEIDRLLSEAQLPRKIRQPLQASLNAAMRSFEAGNLRAGVSQLQAFQHKVQANLLGFNPSLAEALIDAADEVISSIGDKG